ncbi:trichohyalin-like [Gymnodraco acuticeps]|uniref:Trichohyalin-like n=1 Tax=Gymnodraco acuticeps TaxID=8218 RepID=A0A6P8UKA3_GYMAC|nr:trichohyalin-like [Gymnodraco acuticeps]
MAHPIYNSCILKRRDQTMMRKQAEEDYRSESAANEVDFKRTDRHLSLALDAAKDKRFFQNESVRKFHSDLLKEKIRKDNEVIAAYNREIARKADQQRREKEEEIRQLCIDAQRKEEEKTCQRRRDNVALKNELIKRTKEKKLLREEERRQEKKERDHLWALDEQHQQNLRHEQRKELEAKDKKLKLRKEEICRKNWQREREIEKLNMKDKETKRVQTDIEEVLQQRKQEKSEQFKMKQIPKDIVNDQLADAKKQQAAQRIQRDKVKFSKEVAEAEAKVIQRQKDVKEKRDAALKSIATYRVEKHHRNEQKEREEKKASLDSLHQLKQLDRLSEEQTKREVHLKRQNNIKHQEVVLSDAAKNKALHQQKIREDVYASREMEKQIAEGENQIQQYMRQEGGHLPAAQTGQEMPDYNYFCRQTDERLPKRGTAPFSRACLMKRYLERGSLQLATVDVRPHDLPTLSRAGDGSKDAGEPLPTKANSTWQRTPSSEEKIKQYLEKDKFQLKESSTADLRPTRPPTIKTPGAPAGRHSAPTGVESSKNRGKEIGERLPRLDTPKSRDTKQENSKGNLQRTLLTPLHKENSKGNLQRTLLTPLHKENRKGNLQRTLLAPLHKKNSENNLQRTLLTPLHKKNSENNLQRTLLAPLHKENSKGNLQRTLLTPLHKKNSENNLQSTPLAPLHKKNSENNLQRTPLPPLTITNTPAVKICSARVVLRDHRTVTGEPLLRYATRQTQMIKREQEHLTLGSMY